MNFICFWKSGCRNDQLFYLAVAVKHYQVGITYQIMKIQRDFYFEHTVSN